MGLELVSECPSSPLMSDGYASDSDTLSILGLWIRNALNSATESDFTKYMELVRKINDAEPGNSEEEESLAFTLRALSQTTSSISRDHHLALISSIFSISIWNCARVVADSLLEFIINLALANGGFVDECLDMLVRNFLPPACGLSHVVDSFTRRLMGQTNIANQHELLSKLMHQQLQRKEEVLDLVHSALHKIASLVPTASLRLLPIILNRMPHRVLLRDWNVLFVDNMLRLHRSAIGEFIGNKLLMAVVDRLIEIDVEIGWEDILQDDPSKVLFDIELEGFEENDECHGKPGIEASHHFRDASKHSLADVAEKMDCLMEVTFEHLRLCYTENRVDKVFETLLQSFQTTVLGTYKSKFTQFLLFYMCSLDPENCGAKFACLLVDIFVGKNHPPNTRMSAVAYLASYLSRGRFVSSSLVASTLKRLVDWCSEYCKIQDELRKPLNPATHRVFYSGCQAVMYVVCFRIGAIMEIPYLKSHIFRPLESVLHHSLNPLKVCLPSIVEEFLRRTKVADVFTSLATAIVQNLLESENSRTFGGVERLDMFFPFDPYLLKRSERFIRPNFIFWSMVQDDEDDDEFDLNGDDDDDVDECHDYDSSDVNDDGDDIFMDGHMGSYQDEVIGSLNESEFDEFEYSMNKMSITPKSNINWGMPTRSPACDMPARIMPSTSPDW
ncbi:hypothetical protein AMTRI_Chr03g138460 [Amborella trichopoda]